MFLVTGQLENILLINCAQEDRGRSVVLSCQLGYFEAALDLQAYHLRWCISIKICHCIRLLYNSGRDT